MEPGTCSPFGPPPSGRPELEAMRTAVFAALEIRDEADILRGLDRGELEARALHGQRAHAAAPPDVSRQLRLTAQAEADARRRAADAQTRHDHTAAASATALAAQLAAERHHLETASTRYEQWSAGTRITRGTAGKPQPNCNDEDTPGQAANHTGSPKTNRSRWPDGGSSRRTPKP
jgi:hypothetical protein